MWGLLLPLLLVCWVSAQETGSSTGNPLPNPNAAAALEERKVSIEIPVPSGEKSSDELYFATFDATNLARQWVNMAASYGPESVLTATPNPTQQSEKPSSAPSQPTDTPTPPTSTPTSTSPPASPAPSSSTPSTSTQVVIGGDEQRLAAHKIISESRLFHQLSQWSVLEYVHLHKPFGMFVLCDCPEDFYVANILRDLEMKIASRGYQNKMTFLYIMPVQAAIFQLQHAYQLNPGLDAMVGMSLDQNIKELQVFYGRTLPHAPKQVKVNIQDECCGDQFGLEVSEITEKSFRLRVQRTDKPEGWGQNLKVRWTLDQPLHEIPAFVIDNVPEGANNEKFVYRARDHNEDGSREFSADQILNFIDGFFSHSLQLLIRSQPKTLVPVPTRRPGQVVEVVAEDFKEIVLNPNQAVFILIYSPYCGGSLAVMPVIDILADALKDDENVVVAKMDKTINDFPVRGILVTHYPTALLFPAGTWGSPDYHYLDYSDYNGSKTPHNRDVPHSHYEKDTMVKFVREHGNHIKKLV